MWHVYSLIHLVVCLTTGPNPLPKRALHIVRSRASSFKWEYPLLSLRSSSSSLRLLPRLPVTSIPPFIFPSITRCKRQFLRKMWRIQSAFRLLMSCRIFLCSLILSNTSSLLTWSVQLIFSILLQHHISKKHVYSKLCLGSVLEQSRICEVWGSHWGVEDSSFLWYDTTSIARDTASWCDIFVNCSWVNTRWQ